MEATKKAVIEILGGLEKLGLISLGRETKNSLMIRFREKPETALAEIPVIKYPYTDEQFINGWQIWKDFKREQFNFKYKPTGEQAALIELSNLSKSREEALEIIRRSMANGWKGFFPLDAKQVKRKESEDLFAWSDKILKETEGGPQ